MERKDESCTLIKSAKHLNQKTPCEYIVNKKFKTELHDTLDDGNLNIKHEDLEMKQENKRFESTTDIERFQDTSGGLTISSFVSPESFCEVSLEEKCFRCPICPYETNMKKYLKLHLAGQTHLMRDRTKTMFDGYKKVRSSIATQKIVECDPSTVYERANDRMPTLTFDTFYELSLEKKIYRCSQCPYETNSKRCLNTHLSGQVHLYETHGSETTCMDLSVKKNRNAISAVQVVDCDLETLSSHLETIPQNFLCRICGFEASSKRSLSKHTEKVHFPKNPKFILPKKPPLPKYKFEVGGGTKTRYLRNEKVACVVCGYEAKDGIDLKVHNLKHRDISEVLMHKCKYCDGSGSRSCQIRKKRSVPKVTPIGGDTVGGNCS